MPKNRPPFLAVAAGYTVSAGGGAVAASIYSSGNPAGALVQVAAMKAGEQTTKYVAQQMRK